MGLMDLLGDAQKQREYADFAQRYDQGEPHEGIGDEEALGRYQEVTRHLSPEEYEEVSREAFERMSPDQREELGRHLREQTRGQGFADDDEDDTRYRDPGALAGLTGRMHRRQPDMMGQLLGGLGGMGGGGGLGGGGALGAIGGLLGGGAGGMGGMLGNPVARAALAGVAAMAAKRVMGR